MDNLDDEYKNYWETHMFLQSELDSCYLDEAAISGDYDSSSPDGTQSTKNILSERNRRKKLNEKLYALRSVVPNISKMDKASIVRDAIEYIRSLHDEEKKVQAEISELESVNCYYDIDDNQDTDFNNRCNKPSKRTRVDAGSGLVGPSPIEVLELRVFNMEKRITVVSLTCVKRPDTMVRLCEIFESLNLKIVTANIYTFSGKIMKTVFLEGDEEREVLRLKIEEAIAIMNGPDSPMST